MKEGWTYKKLGEVCEKIKTIRWEEINEEDSFSYIDLSSVDRLSLSIKDPQTITKTNAPSRAKQIVKKGDILFATTRPTLRRVCLIPSSFDNQICSTGFCVIRPKENILSKWIYYLLQSDNFYYYIEPLQTGASYPAVTDNVVKGYQISSPSMDEQRAIVARLDSAFAQIDSLKANAEKQLSEARQLFQKALEEAMTPKEGWVEKRLPDISENLDSIRVPVTKKNRTEGKYPYYGASGIVDYVDDYLFDEDLLCISEDGANLLMRTYPIAFPISGKVWVNNHAHVLRFKSMTTQNYVNYYLEGIKLDEYITGAAQPKLTQKALNSIPINIPATIEVQHTIVAHLDSLSSHVRTLEEKLKKMKDECDALKQAILREVFE